MRKFVFLTAVATIYSSSALAADLGAVNTVTPFDQTIPESVSWTGFYAGLNGGYGWAQFGVVEDLEGLFGGIQAGYNYDFGGFVLGVEGDVQLSGINFEQDFVGGGKSYIELNSFATLRARAGITIDRFMPYVTGGVAWAKATAGITDGVTTFEADDDYVGYAVGAGLEYAVTDNITVKSEYLYADFGEADFDLGGDVELSSHMVRVGLNFKF